MEQFNNLCLWKDAFFYLLYHIYLVLFSISWFLYIKVIVSMTSSWVYILWCILRMTSYWVYIEIVSIIIFAHTREIVVIGLFTFHSRQDWNVCEIRVVIGGFPLHSQKKILPTQYEAYSVTECCYFICLNIGNKL